MQELINFTNLTLDEAKMVLEWRNDPKVRYWMHNKEEISLENHLKFIKNLKTAKDKDYFLLKSCKSYLGVIDLNDGYLGIYANPELKKVGDILLRAIVDFAFAQKKLKSLKAEVYKENKNAIKLYERFDFKVVSQDDDLITMELHNEYSKL